MERLTDPPRQVNVRRLHNSVLLLLDVHDAMQRVLGLFLFFLMAREVNDLVLVPGCKFPRDREFAG